LQTPARPSKTKSTDKQRHIQLASDLQQALSMVGAAAYQQANTAGQAAPGAGGQQRPSSEDDVVDAEFTER
jgi:molecular chaperone DnaK